MKKLLFLIVSVFFLSSCGGVIQNNSSNVESVSSYPHITDTVQQIRETYLKNDDFLSCFQKNVDGCIQEVVTQSGEEFDCNDFILEENVINCRISKISQKAKGQEDISLCDSLSSGKETCQLEVALSVGFLEFNTEICDLISDESKTTCVNKIIGAEAKSKKDISICEGIILEDSEIDFDKVVCVQDTIDFIQDERLRLEEEERIQNEEIEGTDGLNTNDVTIDPDLAAEPDQSVIESNEASQPEEVVIGDEQAEIDANLVDIEEELNESN